MRRSVLVSRFLLTVLLSLLHHAKTFNVDTSSPIVKAGPKRSYFGFSVVHKMWEDPKEDFRNRIIVGAPKYSNPAVINGGEHGAVYSCSSILSDSCEMLPYNPPDPPSNYVENRTGMWYGVAVAGEESKEGSIIACGHRSVFANVHTGSLSIVGRCLRYLQSGDTESYSPCIEEQFDNEDSFYGWCQAGSSVAFHRSNLFIGAPGSTTWSGAFKWQDESTFNAFVPGTRKYSYFGSSVVAATNLLGDNRIIAASGAPKADDVGEVLLFDQQTASAPDSGVLRLTLRGDQFGSSFGHSITTVDVTSNTSPSLVVSAPYYRGRNIGGAIYIYDNYGQGIQHTTPRKIQSRTMTDRDCADLRCEDAAFGYSLASIGDINGDGYNDLAVGAPYEGAGAVYIFLGGKDDTSGKYRLSETFSQRIYAGELPQSPLGFGVSVAGYDYPSNTEGYDGLIVGAYKSDKVYLLRSRPIVTISAYILPTSPEIDPGASRCTNLPDVAMPCAMIKICFRASSNRNLGGITIAYKLIGDAGEARVARRRIQMSPIGDTTELSNQTLTTIGIERCVEHLSFVREVRDLLKPITMVVEYDVSAAKPISARASLLSYPVINVTSSRSAKYDLQFKKQCVTLLCDTNIAIALNFSDSFVTPDDNTSSNTFVFSSGEIDIVSLAIAVSVDSASDISPAYEPVVSVDLPQQLSFSAYESSVRQPISCSANSTRVTCVLPKIMPKGSVVTFSVKLKVVTLGSVPSTIVAFVNLSNHDISMADNVKNISIRQVIKTDLAIVGQAEGAQAFYNDSIRGSKAILYLDEIGSYVMHRYTIVNNGPGDVARVTLTTEWPYETMNNGYLLYMEREPELRSEEDNSLLPCTFDGSKINPEGYVARPSSSQTSAGIVTTTVPSRGRRSVSGSGENAVGAAHDGSSPLPRQRVVPLDCRIKTAKCFNITCNIAFFRKRTRYVLSLPARLWGSTLWSEGYKHDVEVVNIISRASLYIDPALNIEQPTQNDVAFVSTAAQPSIAPPSKEYVAWWIYAVAGGAGLVLLVAIILIFWKCGFFQRHRPMLHEGKVEKKRSESDHKYEAVPTSEKAQ